MPRGMCFIDRLTRDERIVFRFITKMINYDENDHDQMRQIYETIKKIGVN